jgi:hypothetical protein
LILFCYEHETFSLTLREGHRLKAFENRVLKRIFGPKREEVIGGSRKMHNEQLHNLYCSQNLIIMIKSSRMRWVWHVACTGIKGMHTGFWWESQTEGDHSEDLDACERITFRLILEKQDGVVRTGVIWLRIGTSGGLLLRRQ